LKKNTMKHNCFWFSTRNVFIIIYLFNYFL